MEASYKDVCIRYDLDDRLLALENAKHTDARSVNISAAGAINESLEQLKRTEIEGLSGATKQVEADSAKLRERASKLRAAVSAELQLASQEKLQM